MNPLIAFFARDRNAYFFIVLNGLALFCLGFSPDALGMNPERARHMTFWEWVDYLCVLYFVLETAAKIKVGGWRAYWRDGWNRFDFFVVCASLPVLAAPFVYIGDFRAATLVRLGRLFRLFRLLHIIPNRDHLARGIHRAIRSSVGVFLALFLMVLILSLGATFLFGPRAPEYFGNPIMSFYTTFKVFTVEGWYEVPEAIAAGNADIVFTTSVRLFFMASVLTCGILGLSMANAVFVDEMVMDNTDGLEAKIDQLQADVAALRELLEAQADASERTD